MTDEQIELLKNALDLYQYALELNNPCSFDDNSTARVGLYYMRKELSKLIGKEI